MGLFERYLRSSGQDCAVDWFHCFSYSSFTWYQPGPDDTICAGETYQMQGSASNYDSIHWSSDGDGTFHSDTLISPVYTPGYKHDIITGQVKLKLTGYAQYGNIMKPCFWRSGIFRSLPSPWLRMILHAPDRQLPWDVDTINNGKYLWIPGGMTTPVITVDTALTGGINTTKVQGFCN